MKILNVCFLWLFAALFANAQSYEWVCSTEGHLWQKSKVSIQKKGNQNLYLEINDEDSIVKFKAWGTCFNEKGWDALNLLQRKEQETILSQLFSPNGDLRFSMGRFSMNANDYARDWYSCDEVDGDFQLKHFNIDRDKTTLIPYIKAAQEYNPDMTFWISPWSPPSWMKINHYYSVVSNDDYNKMDKTLNYILYEGGEKKDDKYFPGQLAVNDYLIQDPRYLKSYANYFSKFISSYQKEGIPINMVMFQNESWSYTPYPGCAWTPEGIIRFNVEYLAPTLKETHSDVKVYLGTINTNRYEIIDEVLSDERMSDAIQGIGFQWEGGQILPALREKYPDYKYVQTESECGWGSFDWGGAERTFDLINYYLGNGCEEYTFWNAILSDDGVSGWGWKQNALIRVDSESRTATYTPEYYAVKHYTHFVSPGSKIVSIKNNKEDKTPVLVVVNPEGKYIILVGNFNDESKNITVKINKDYLSMLLPAHSFNSFIKR